MLQLTEFAIQKHKEERERKNIDIFDPANWNPIATITNAYHSAEEMEAASKRWDEAPMMNNAWRLEGGEKRAIDNILRASEEAGLPFFTGNEMEKMLANSTKYNYDRAKKLTHDVNYYESGEKAFKDKFFNAPKYDKMYPTLLQPEEAHALSKELGYEHKWDKPVTEGAVRFLVEDRLKKRELEDELAYYMSTRDFNSFERLRLMGAALSGSIGALELAETAAISYIIAQTGGAAANVLGTTALKGTNLFRGIRAAQKTYLASKQVNVARNVAKASEEAARTLRLTKRAEEAATQMRLSKSMSEKLGYDAYRFATQQMGQHASLATTMVPFAIDGMVSTIPVAMLKQEASEINGEYYDTRDALAEVAMGGAFGAGMPVAGKGLKVAGSLAGKGIGLTGKAIDKSYKTVSNIFNNAAAEEAMKGHIGDAEVIQATGDEVLKELGNVFSTVTSTKNADIQHANALQIKSMNHTEDELSELVIKAMRSVTEGSIPLEVAMDPATYRSTYFTRVPGMRNAFTEIIGQDLSIQDIAQIFYKHGVRMDISDTSKVLSKNSFDFLLNPLKPYSIQFANEQGVLGKHAIRALNPDEAFHLLKNIYISKLFPEEQAGQLALQEASAYLERLGDIKTKFDKIVQMYDYIIQQNSNGHLISYDRQLEMYSVEDGRGSLRQAMYEAIDACMPEDIQLVLNDLRNKITESDLELGMKGRRSVLDSEYQEWHKAIQEYEESINEILNNNFLVTEKGYVNLRTKEGSTDMTRKLREISEALDSMIKDSDALLSDEFPALDNLGTMEEILEKISNNSNNMTEEELLNKLNAGEDIPEFGIYFDSTKLSHKQINEIISSEHADVQRLQQTKAKLATYEGSKELERYKSLIASMDKSVDNHKMDLNFIQNNAKTISTIENILTEDTLELQEKILADLIDNKKILHKGPNGLEISINSVRKLLKEHFLDIYKRKLGSVHLNRDLEEMINEALYESKKFFEELDTTKLQAALKENKAVVGDTAEEVGAKVENSEARRMFVNDLLNPLINKFGIKLMNIQNDAINNQIRYIDNWAKIKSVHAIYMPEMATDIVSSGSSNAKGAGVSIEKMSNALEDKRTIMRNLIKASKKREVFDYARNSENSLDIFHSIIMRNRDDLGLLSEAEKATFDFNSDASVCAQIMMDQMGHYEGLYFAAGSNKKRFISMFDPQKINKPHLYLPSVEGTKGHKAVERYTFLHKFQKPRNSSNSALSEQRFNIWALEHTDLDGLYNKNGKFDFSLNGFRDDLLNQMSELDLAAKYGKDNLKTILTEFNRIFFTNNDTKTFGLFDKLTMGSKSPASNMMSQSSKYLDDLDPKIMFKNADSELEAVKYFGFDTVDAWIDHNFSSVKRGYTVLTTLGSEPTKMADSLKQAVRFDINENLPFEAGFQSEKGRAKIENLKKQTKVNGYWDREFDYCVNQVCGNYSDPATGMLKWAKIAAQVIGSPMIIKAGLKSFTDYENQVQVLINMGLNSAWDMDARIRTTAGLVRAITGDEKLAEALYMTNLVNANSLKESFLGVSSMTGKMNEFASFGDKAQQLANAYTDFITNKLAWIEPLTNRNRTNAALNVMRGIGNFKDTTWDDLAPSPSNKYGPNFQATLERYGITKEEWNDILTKHCCESVYDYLVKTNSSADPNMFRNHIMFFADNILRLDDNILRDVMRKQKMTDLSDTAVNQYRYFLTDKASLIVNASADEMTALPTARVNSILHAGYDNNSVAGTIAGIATQFQSFGVSAWFYHYGRRLGTFMDYENPHLDNILLSSMGLNTAFNMFGMLTEIAFWNYVMMEGIGWITGTRKVNRDDFGNLDWGVIGEKVLKAYVDSLGWAGAILDTVYTMLTNPSGTGGGLSIPVAPAASSILRSSQRLLKAGTREVNEGRRMQAIGGQLAIEALDYTGIPRHPFTQAIWGCTIGDWLDQVSQGTDYYQNKENRYRRGYRGNFITDKIKGGSIY